MDRNTELLVTLRHQRLQPNWARSSLVWSDFRGMIPLALVGGFLLDKYITAITASQGTDNLADCFKTGIEDWFRLRSVVDALKEPGDWPLWMQEYKQALSVSPECFKRATPAKIAASVFSDWHNLEHPLSQTFIANKPERLQVALLHIEHLPENTRLYEHELDFWAKASPELRLVASPEIGEWYNLVQDEALLRWHIHNRHTLNPTTYPLPDNLTPDAGNQP